MESEDEYGETHHRLLGFRGREMSLVHDHYQNHTTPPGAASRRRVNGRLRPEPETIPRTRSYTTPKEKPDGALRRWIRFAGAAQQDRRLPSPGRAGRQAVDG